MRTYSPGGILIAFAAAPKPLWAPTPSIHRLRRGLPGYLILFAPHAFEPQCQLQSSEPRFATGVPPNIYAFHRYTRNSTHPSPHSSLTVSKQFRVEPRIFTSDLHGHLHSFTPSKSGLRLLHTYYRGCWHVFSRSFLVRYRPYLPADRALHNELLLHSRGVAASEFPPLCNIPHCCLP